MRFLPAIIVDEQHLQLPCPDRDMVGLAVALATNDQKIAPVLGQSPELMLYAFHEFYHDQQRPADSISELSSWFSGFFTARLKELPAGWSSEVPIFLNSLLIDWYEESRRQFLRNRSGDKNFRKSLVRFARCFPGLRFKSTKRWIKKIVGKEIADWRITGGADEFESIFCLSRMIHENTKEFEARLQQEKLSSLKQLAYGASHEINNPLANISTRAQSLLAGEFNPERRRKLAIIFEQAMRAHEMISDMMLFAHPPEIKLEHIDVYDIAKQVLEEMRPAIRNLETTADLRRYPNVRKIWVDSTQISVAFKALLRNSLEAIEAKQDNERGKIIVRVWPKNDSVLSVSIADNGAGLTPAAKKHLFDPFFSGREAGRGLGFGLSKAWRISQLHDGELVWDDSYQGGTQFILRLPMKRKIPSSRIDNAFAA